jgi:hypothetical protein
MKSFSDKIQCGLTKLALVFGLSFLIGLSAGAQTLKSGSLTNGANLIVSGPTIVYDLQVLNRDAAAALLTLYDNSSATSTNTVKTALTTYTLGKATNSVIFTNINSVVETNTYVYLARTTNTTAAATNEATRVYRITVPAASSVLIQPNDGYGMTRGFQMHWLGTNADYNLQYRTLP